METHPAIADSASTTTTTPPSHEGKVESCAVINDGHQEERTCESKSLSTSTTSTSIQEDQLNTSNAPLDIYENNNTDNHDESIALFSNQQQPLQPSVSSSSRHSNNDNININNSDHDSLSDQQHQSEEEQSRNSDSDIDLQQREQSQQQEQQRDIDDIRGIRGQEDNGNIQEGGTEEVQEQTRIIDQDGQDEVPTNGQNESDVHDNNVSQVEHVTRAEMTLTAELSDRLSLHGEVDGSSLQEAGSRSSMSTNVDQHRQSGAAPLDECIEHTDKSFLDVNQDEERRPHVDEESLPTQAPILQQHDNEIGTNVSQIHVELQEQSNAEQAEPESLQDNTHGDNDADVIEEENGRNERVSDNVAEFGSVIGQSQPDIHVSSPSPSPSSEEQEQEARGPDHTERAMIEVESPISAQRVEEEQQANVESPLQLDNQGASNRGFERITSTDGHAIEEIYHHEQQNLAVPAVNGTSIQPEQHQHSVGAYEYQQHSSTANHSQDDASDHTVHSAPRSRRIWEADRQASECRRCNRRFNFLVRRHHCRRCGLVVCDRCSGHRIRLPPEDIVQDPAIDPSHYPLIAMHPQRVCDVCNRLPIKEIPASSSSPRRRATAPVSMSHMKRSPSSQSLMTECPVCGTDLLGMQKEDQEKHLQLCLNTGSPPVRPPRYLVYELSETSPQIDYECPICFEEFKAGEKIARMICLCSYHHRCLSDWLERGKGCPVHYDATISA